MALRKPVAFPFFADDWLSSPRIMLMTPAEEGAYIRLLAHCWSDENCSLPDDDAELAVLSRTGPDWQTYRTRVRVCFCEHPTCVRRLTNKKLFELHREAIQFRESRRAAGVKSGESRRSGTNTCSTHVEQVLNSPLPSPSPSPIKGVNPLKPPGDALNTCSNVEQAKAKKPKTLITIADVSIPADIDTPAVRTALDKWLAYKRKRRQGYTAGEHISEKLQEFTTYGAAAFVAAVSKSIGNNWQGLFAPGERNDRTDRHNAAGKYTEPGAGTF